MSETLQVELGPESNLPIKEGLEVKDGLFNI